jgi:hypothetical protein
LVPVVWPLIFSRDEPLENLQARSDKVGFLEVAKNFGEPNGWVDSGMEYEQGLVKNVRIFGLV